LILTFNNSDRAVTFGQLDTYAGARAHAADIEAALNPAELAEWHTALTQAEAEGTFSSLCHSTVQSAPRGSSAPCSAPGVCRRSDFSRNSQRSRTLIATQAAPTSTLNGANVAPAELWLLVRIMGPRSERRLMAG